MMKVAGFLVLVAFVAAAKASPPGERAASSNDSFSTCPKPETIKDGMSCLEVIKLMSKCDKCLDTRQDQKREAAKNASTPEEFVKLMKGKKCNGTEYNCGNTRSYVTEIFEGLPAHFEESKYDDGTEEGDKKSQNLRYTAATLRQLFEKQAGSPNTIIYHMRHDGTHDHVWTVEQLPNGQGYRVYQSYHDGYSLLAWLAEGDLDSLFRPDDGDLMIWRTVQKHVDGAVRMMSNGTASVSNITTFASNPAFKDILPYVSYVINYDKDLHLSNFKKGWEKYGKGQIVGKEAFMGSDSDSFISKLVSLVGYLEKHGVNDSSPYAREPWDNWMDLYGGPDPTYYPGVPNNAVIGLMQPGAKYGFRVKSVEIKGEPQCAKNARVILGE